MKSCMALVITEKFLTQDFKQYEVKDENNRLELMMPYNQERGLRMFISGPPRCGKSHLIGEILREYVRHYPKRPIYLFSQVENDRAIDNVIKDSFENLKWDQNLFNRIDLINYLQPILILMNFVVKLIKKQEGDLVPYAYSMISIKYKIKNYKLKLIN